MTAAPEDGAEEFWELEKVRWKLNFACCFDLSLFSRHYLLVHFQRGVVRTHVDFIRRKTERLIAYMERQPSDARRLRSEAEDRWK